MFKFGYKIGSPCITDAFMSCSLDFKCTYAILKSQDKVAESLVKYARSLFSTFFWFGQCSDCIISSVDAYCVG